jgi:hypothetical protein
MPVVWWVSQSRDYNAVEPRLTCKAPVPMVRELMDFEIVDRDVS